VIPICRYRLRGFGGQVVAAHVGPGRNDLLVDLHGLKVRQANVEVAQFLEEGPQRDPIVTEHKPLFRAIIQRLD
jgi:hypothetical protein